MGYKIATLGIGVLKDRKLLVYTLTGSNVLFVVFAEKRCRGGEIFW